MKKHNIKLEGKNKTVFPDIRGFLENEDGAVDNRINITIITAVISISVAIYIVRRILGII